MMKRLVAATLDPSEDKDSGGDSGGGSGGGGTTVFKQNTTVFRKQTSTLIQRIAQSVIEQLPGEGSGLQGRLDPVIQARNRDISEAFKTLERQTLEFSDTLMDADIDAHRKGLKAQATMFQFKLESSRAANNVNLQNQAAEMTHSFDTQMEKKVRDMQSGEADLLTQAHEEMAELKAELHEKRKELDKAEQLIKTTKKLLSNKEAQEIVLREQAQTSNETLVRMQSQLEELRIAHAEAMAEVDRRVSESSEEVRKEVERAASASRDQERLAMQRLEERVRSMSLELDSARMEAAAAKAAEGEARRELAAESSRASTPAVEAERKMREMRAEQERMLAQLQGSKEAVAREQQETARLKLASSESNRRLVEAVSRSASAARRAASVDEDAACRQQVAELADWLETESERRVGETTEKQLVRLLDEIKRLKQNEVELQARLKAGAAADEHTEMLKSKLKAAEATQWNACQAITNALVRANVRAESTKLDLLLTQLLGHVGYEQVATANMRELIEDAMADLSVGTPTGATPLEKLSATLKDHRRLRRLADSMRDDLNLAATEMQIKGVSEGAKLEERFHAVMAAVRRGAERERHLNEGLKRQHSSLHHAYHRCKEVEAELARSVGAAAEQREALVRSSLHALQQLRTHLGAIHAIRPEVTRPLDEALKITKPPTLTQAGLPPGPYQSVWPPNQEARPKTTGGIMNGHLTGLTTGPLLPASPSLPSLQSPPKPKASSSKQVMEFLEHVAQSSAALVYSAGLPPDWVQALSRPVASHGAQHSPRNAWSAPHPQQQQLHPQQQHSSLCSSTHRRSPRWAHDPTMQRARALSPPSTWRPTARTQGHGLPSACSRSQPWCARPHRTASSYPARAYWRATIRSERTSTRPASSPTFEA